MGALEFGFSVRLLRQIEDEYEYDYDWWGNREQVEPCSVVREASRFAFPMRLRSFPEQGEGLH